MTLRTTFRTRLGGSLGPVVPSAQRFGSGWKKIDKVYAQRLMERAGFSPRAMHDHKPAGRGTWEGQNIEQEAKSSLVQRGRDIFQIEL